MERQRPAQSGQSKRFGVTQAAPRRARRSDAGQDLVEMALILPLLMALLMGIIEFGVIIWRYNTVANAAREGARAGVVDECGDAAVQEGVGRLIVGLEPSPTVEHDDTDGVCTVTVDYAHSLITGGFLQGLGLPGSLDLSATSSMIIE